MGLFPPLDIFARAVLAPVLIWQGLSIRRHALVLPEADGAREGVIGDGVPLRLLILGDSSGAGVGVNTQDEALSGQITCILSAKHRVVWKLIARTGATTRDADALLDAAKGDAFDVAFLALGVNDAVRLVRLGTWRRQQSDLRQRLRTEFGVKQIVVTSMPPLDKFPALTPLLRWVLGAHAKRLGDALTKDIATETDVVQLVFDVPFSPDQMASDGYHPNASTYALWGRKAAESILMHH